MNNQKLSVLVGCYGNYPQYSLRSVASILNPARSYDIHVGCNACSMETIQTLRQYKDQNQIDTLVESSHNINKDPMIRSLLEFVNTEYVLWMDDDSYFIGEWFSHIEKFILNNDFDCAGHVFFCHKGEDYKAFLRKRPWYRGDDCFQSPEHRDVVWFATGGCFLVKTQFLKRYDFPDRGMVKRQDDLLLGDLISQQNGRLINFSSELMSALRISDGNRRGAGESDDGWRENPTIQSSAGLDKLCQSQFEYLWHLSDKTLGWLTRSEAELAYNNVKSVSKDLAIVEVGSYHGKATLILASEKHFVLAINNLQQETFYGSDLGLSGTDFVTFESFVKENPTVCWTQEWDPSKLEGKQIGLALIDGCHTNPAPLQDFERLQPYLAPNALLLFHDYGVFEGVNSCVSQLEHDGIISMCNIVDSMFIGQYSEKRHLRDGQCVTGIAMVAMCHNFGRRGKLFVTSINNSKELDIPIHLTLYYSRDEDLQYINSVKIDNEKFKIVLSKVSEHDIMRRAIHFGNWRVPDKQYSHVIFMDADLCFDPYFFRDYVEALKRERPGYWSAVVKNIPFDEAEQVLKSGVVDFNRLESAALDIRYDFQHGRVGHFQCIPSNFVQYPLDPISAVNRADDIFAMRAVARSSDQRSERRLSHRFAYHLDHPHSWSGSPIQL